MKMRRYDPRLIVGILLVLGGLLALLDQMGIIPNAWRIFWGLIFAAGGLAFLYMLINDRTSWWAAFPAFILFGLALSYFLPDSLREYEGLLRLAGISFAFLWVYFTNTLERWWAIIPAGVLLTLGVVSALESTSGVETGGILFLGLGLTFMLVAVLPGGRSRSWALIPGTILLVFGAFLGAVRGGSEYFWPLALVVLGGFFLWRFFSNRPAD
jgi:hypothetical protein